MRGMRVVQEKIKAGYKVIFMPLYKTFIDFFVLLYVHQT